MIYLASPYSDPDSEVQYKRASAALTAAAYFMVKDVQVFSPIAYGVMLESSSSHGSEVKDLSQDRWMDYDLDMLVRCDVMFILAIDGWKESKGVQEDISFAKDHLIPIYTVDPDECYYPKEYNG